MVVFACHYDGAVCTHSNEKQQHQPQKRSINKSSNVDSNKAKNTRASAEHYMYDLQLITTAAAAAESILHKRAEIDL